MTLENAIALVEGHASWRARVVYGDTDSLFVALPGRTRAEAHAIGWVGMGACRVAHAPIVPRWLGLLRPHLTSPHLPTCNARLATTQRSAKIAAAVTASNPRPVTLKLEKVYQPCVLQTKKRYVGFAYEAPEQTLPVFDAKGIETIRCVCWLLCGCACGLQGGVACMVHALLHSSWSRRAAIPLPPPPLEPFDLQRRRDSCPAVAKMLEASLRLLFMTKDLSAVKDYATRQWAKMLSNRVSVQVSGWKCRPGKGAALSRCTRSTPYYDSNTSRCPHSTIRNSPCRTLCLPGRCGWAPTLPTRPRCRWPPWWPPRPWRQIRGLSRATARACRLW